MKLHLWRLDPKGLKSPTPREEGKGSWILKLMALGDGVQDQRMRRPGRQMGVTSPERREVDYECTVSISL